MAYSPEGPPILSVRPLEGHHSIEVKSLNLAACAGNLVLFITYPFCVLGQMTSL